LINDYSITSGQVINFPANFFDDATDLMTKNLRIDIEWNRLPIFVGVVVGMTGEDVGVGPAKTHGRDAHHDFMRARARQRNVAYLEPFDAAEHTRAHRGA
jgi:hypothetical protein